RNALFWYVDRAYCLGTPVRRTVKRIAGNPGGVRRSPDLTRCRLLDSDERVRRPGAWPIAREAESGTGGLEALPAIGRKRILEIIIESLLGAAECRLHHHRYTELGKPLDVGGVREIRMLDAQTSVTRTMCLLDTFVSIENHVHRIVASRVRHDLKAKPIELHDQSFVSRRRINERRDESRSTPGEELDYICRYPFVVIELAGLFKVAEEFRRQSGRNGRRPESRTGPDRKLAAIPQGGIQANFLQVTGGVANGGDSEDVKVSSRLLQHLELSFERHLPRNRALHHFHPGLKQHATRPTARVANDPAFLRIVRNGSIRNPGHADGRGVKPQRMLRGVVNNKWTVGPCAVEQLLAGCSRRGGTEVRACKQHRIGSMCLGIGLQAFDDELRLIDGDAGFRRREIEAVQSVGSVERV